MHLMQIGKIVISSPLSIASLTNRAFITLSSWLKVFPQTLHAKKSSGMASSSFSIYRSDNGVKFVSLAFFISLKRARDAFEILLIPDTLDFCEFFEVPAFDLGPAAPPLI